MTAHQPISAGLDPEGMLRSRPVGTKDYKRVLAAIVAVHNDLHAVKGKFVSIETRHDRREFLFGFFRELRSETPFRDADPRRLGNRHVQVMVDRWVQRGLATGTIHKYLSYLRVYGEWINKPGLVYEPAQYLKDAPERAVRVQVATEDRSWTSRHVDIAEQVAKVAAFDPWVGLQLELCWRFALRGKEARHLRPHDRLYSREQVTAEDATAHPEATVFLRVYRGTKGGRQRFVPVTTPEQHELLERLRVRVPRGAFVGDPSHSHLQSQNRFYYVLRKCGITKDGLEVTAHGLRHQAANDFYEAQLGEPSAVRGGSARSEAERRTRARTSRLLGHGRLQITSAYLGAAVATGRLRGMGAGRDR